MGANHDYDGDPPQVGVGNAATYTTSSAGAHTHSVTINSAGAHTHNISSEGGGIAHNIVSPYIAVYIWRRVA